MHPQLTKLYLSDNGTMGRNECTALSTLLRCTTTRLQKLDLDCNDINDEGVEVLVNALANGNQLKELYLGSNESITSRGWKTLATLLEMPGSAIKKLSVGCNDIGDEGALVFANALQNNSTLETLNLYRCGITDEGWAPFSRLLCDASSVNNTYMSNHTLEEIRKTNDPYVNKYLLLNKREDKQQVAMSKILQRHSHFDMQPFFEWEFKVLLIMIKWFTKAAARVTTYEQKISRLRLSATFDFIKEFPMLYIEPVTRKEISEYTAMEEQLLQGGQVGSAPGHLEVIRRCKTRAMRRL
jgi:Leucine-rich repeat (LRR) protein